MATSEIRSKKREELMQPKISNFFKPSSSSVLNHIVDEDDNEELIWEKSGSTFNNVVYKRRIAISDRESNSEDMPLKQQDEMRSKTLNKKRNYAQLHLELGQSDFLLRTCNTCGIKYAPGDEDDEKTHKTLHINYTRGIPFKSWRNGRIVDADYIEGGHVILVLDSDPLAQRNKVQEVVKMMENELGEGWILHKQCKVYLYISSHRIAGCVVVEAIKEAFKIVSSPGDVCSSHGSRAKKTTTNSTTLKFGGFSMRREAVKRPSSNKCHEVANPSQIGAIVCENEPIAAVCGIRALWVTPSNRRKGIASQLLDVVRKSFCTGFVLERSQLAFSQPTSAGKAFAVTYTSNHSFLVYKTDV